MTTARSKAFSLCMAILGSALMPSASAQYSAGDEIRLTRDVPLLFNGNKYRDGKSGEVFPVVQYRPVERRIYVLQTDSSGKQFAVSIEDSAILLAPQNPYALVFRGINALASSDYAAAVRLFEKADLVDGGVSMATGLKTFAHNLQTTAAELARAIAAEKQVQPDLERRARNARVANRPNLLTGGNDNQVRAAGILQDAQQLAKKHRNAVEKAQQDFMDALRLGKTSVETLAAAECFSAAVAMDDALVLLAKKSGSETRSMIGQFERERFAKRAAEAEAALKSARAALASRKIVAALKYAQSGLSAESGRGDIRTVRDEASEVLNRVRALLGEALVLQEAKKFEEALEKLKAGQVRCADFEDLNQQLTRLTATITEKGSRLEKARAAETAGDFAAAFATFDQYGLKQDSLRVLPLLAKTQEQNGAFMQAYASYEAAGMSADMLRVRALKDEQETAYRQAKLSLSELKFEEALAIYDRYKDQRARVEVLQQKGAWQESANKFEEALATFRDAGLPDEVARVHSFMTKRSEWMDEAAKLELAENWDKSLDLYRRARAKEELLRLSRKIAESYEKLKDYALAVEYFEQGGAHAEAARLRKLHDLKSAPTRELSIAEVFRRCAPGCVTVARDVGGGLGVGSGFFVAKGGYILTNNHVVDGAKKVAVIMPDGQTHLADVIDRSETPDIALLKASISEHPLLRIGDSTSVATGSSVVAIGTPKGLEQSISDGIISNASRDYLGNKCFQINVAINHGNSGGPLLDRFGSVIGINTFGEGTAFVLKGGKGIGSDIQGINYAIKIKEAEVLLKRNGL